MLPRSFLIVAVTFCLILIRNDLVKAQDFLSNVPTPNPVYAHGTGVLSTRSEVVLIGGVGTNRAQVIENQVTHLNYAGTQAGWKRNNNRDLPNLAGVSVVPYGDQRLLLLAPNGPDFRAGQSAALDPATNQVFVYGGAQKNGTLSRELWRLNLTDSSWKLYPPTTNSHPVPLGTTSTVVSNYFVWVPANLNATDPSPPPRSASRITAIANNQILMFGGGNFSEGTAFDDLWTLDGTELPQIKWTRQTRKRPRTMAWQENWGKFRTGPGDITNTGAGGGNNNNGTITTSGGGGGLSSGAVARFGAAIALLFVLVVGLAIYHVRWRRETKNNLIKKSPESQLANSDQGSVTLRNFTISVSSYPSPSYPQAAHGVQTIDPSELGSSVGSQVSSPPPVGVWSQYPVAMTVPSAVSVSGDTQPYNVAETYMLMPPNSQGAGITQRNQSLRAPETQQPVITVTDTHFVVTATDRYVPSASDELSLSAGDHIIVEYVYYTM
ncbi:hypothetical protein HK102_010676, partial [Quaeritorhiza haematococci]